MCIRPFLKKYIRPLPELIVDEPPFMSAARSIRRHEYFPGMYGKDLAAARGKFQHSGKCDDILCGRGHMPVERTMRRRFSEDYRLCFDESFIRHAADFDM